MLRRETAASVDVATAGGLIAAAMIAPGEKLGTDFKLTVVRGGVAREVGFAELLTQRTVVSVYMKNNTPSCDRQNAGLAEVAPELARAGFALVGLSRDTAGAQVRYAAKHKVAYVLASDPEDRFSKAAGAMVEKSMYGRSFVGPARAVYVLDGDGTVLAVAPKVDTADHAAQVRALVAGL